MRRLIYLFLGLIVLNGCATVALPTDKESSIVVGELKLHVSGMGTANNGANGDVNTDFAQSAAVFLQNEASGKTYELRTDIGNGFFSLANAEPGTYKVVGLCAQVNTINAYVTITSSSDKSPHFQLDPFRLVNLGIIRWDFSYDLALSKNTNTFDFNTDYQSVARTLSHEVPSNAWADRQSDQVVFSGEIDAKPLVNPVQLPVGHFRSCPKGAIWSSSSK